MQRITLPIFYHHELFADGVSRLLRGQDFDPVLIDAREVGALEQLRLMRPRLILVEGNPDDVAFAETIGQILSGSPTIGIIRLCLNSNQISLYSVRQLMAYGTGDLVEAFRQLENSCGEQEGQTAEPALVE